MQKKRTTKVRKSSRLGVEKKYLKQTFIKGGGGRRGVSGVFYIGSVKSRHYRGGVRGSDGSVKVRANNNFTGGDRTRCAKFEGVTELRCKRGPMQLKNET